LVIFSEKRGASIWATLRKIEDSIFRKKADSVANYRRKWNGEKAMK